MAPLFCTAGLEPASGSSSQAGDRAFGVAGGGFATSGGTCTADGVFATTGGVFTTTGNVLATAGETCAADGDDFTGVVSAIRVESLMRDSSLAWTEPPPKASMPSLKRRVVSGQCSSSELPLNISEPDGDAIGAGAPQECFSRQHEAKCLRRREGE